MVSTCAWYWMIVQLWPCSRAWLVRLPMPCIYLDTGFLLYCQECPRYLWVFADSTTPPHYLSAQFHHEMEAFSVLLALCVGNTPVTGGIPSQRGSEAYLWCHDIFDHDVWLNDVFITNKRMAGDLRRHDAHCVHRNVNPVQYISIWYCCRITLWCNARNILVISLHYARRWPGSFHGRIAQRVYEVIIEIWWKLSLLYFLL